MRFFGDAVRCTNPLFVPSLCDTARWRTGYTVMLVVIQTGVGEYKALALRKHFTQRYWTLLRKEEFNVQGFPTFDCWHRAHYDYDARACDTNDDQFRLLSQSGLIVEDEQVRLSYRQ